MIHRHTYRVALAALLAPSLFACRVDVELGREGGVTAGGAGGADGAGTGAGSGEGGAEGPTDGFSYPSFDADCSGLLALGAATCVEGAIELDDSTTDNRGGAFFPCAIPFGPDTSFAVELTFRMVGDGDGLALVFHADREGPTALGSAGGGLGYVGLSPGYAVEFDHLEQGDPPGERLEIADGEGNRLALTSPGITLADATLNYAWVDYTAETQALSVRVSKSPAKPAAPRLETLVDFGPLRADGVYFGVTAGYGESVGRHSVLSFSADFRQLASPLACGT